VTDNSRLHQLLLRAYRSALDAVFPARCPGCGKLGSVWCSGCHARLIRCPISGCPQCGYRHRGRCRMTYGYPLSIRSYAVYRPPLIKAILELKYRPNRALGRVMADWLQTIFNNMGWQADLIVPVPLAVARQRQRGYNQVELISSPLAEALDLPHYRSALKRIRDTGSQVGRDFQARRTNVEGAFGADPHYFAQKKILLIDDLVTTGATMRACSQALIEAGASQIFALTVGRAAG
jgi:ComF family protein